MRRNPLLRAPAPPRSFSVFSTRLKSIGLLKSVKDCALEVHVSLQDLYEGYDRAPSISAARRHVYLRLMEDGMGLNEVARLFDRSAGGMRKLIGRKT